MDGGVVPDASGGAWGGREERRRGEGKVSLSLPLRMSA